MKPYNTRTLKNILITIILIFLSVTSIYGANLITDQNTTYEMYNKNIDYLTNTYETIIFDDNSVSLPRLNQSSVIGDYLYHIANFNNNAYFYFTNSVPENTITFYTNCHAYDNSNTLLTTYNITLHQTGRYYFVLQPDYPNEYCDVMINQNNLTSFTDMFVTNQNTNTRESLFSPLITATQELMVINIQIWRVLFYLLISSIVLGVVYSLFKLGFYLLEKTKQLTQSHEQESAIYNFKNKRK